MSDSGSNAKSDASSSMSDFVLRRYTGDVPVLGGDIRVGARELSVAMTQSFRNSGLLDVLGSLSDTLRGISTSHSTPTIGRAESSLHSPIRLDDDDIETKLDQAGQLDDVKIRMMLEASMLQSAEVDAFANLLSVSRDSARKKIIGMRTQAQRREASLRTDRHVTTPEVMQWYSRSHANVTELVDKMYLWTHIDRGVGEFSENVHRALLHESVFTGRCTNRKLALIGDEALKLAFVEFGVRREYSVGDISSYMHASQSNLALRTVGKQAGLAQYIQAVPDIDVTSRNIMATVVEALYGAAYVSGGLDAVNSLNSSPMMVYDSEALEVRSRTLSVPGLAIESMEPGDRSSIVTLVGGEKA